MADSTFPYGHSGSEDEDFHWRGARVYAPPSSPEGGGGNGHFTQPGSLGLYEPVLPSWPHPESDVGKRSVIYVAEASKGRTPHAVELAANLPATKSKLPTKTSKIDYSGHDTTIKAAVTNMNGKMAATPGFTQLDWLWIKAMIMQEAKSGPGTAAWDKNPMQLGKASGSVQDPALKVLQTGAEHSDLIVDEVLKAKLNKKVYSNQTPGKGQEAMDAVTSIQGGVAYLFCRAAKFETKVVESGESKEVTVAKGDSLSKIADRVGTLVSVLEKYNPGISKTLQPGNVLKYRKAEAVWHIVGWRSWTDAIKRYNGGGDPSYLKTIQKNYHDLKVK